MTLRLTEEFKLEIQKDPSNCVLFVGAGLSAYGVRNGGMGLPDWDTLMQYMIEDLHDSQKCDDATLEKLKKSLKQGKHLDIAKAFKERKRPDQFADFLRAKLDPDDIVSSDIHKVILKTGFFGIITTNFDMVFEHHSTQVKPLVYPQFLEEPAAFKKRDFFAKIHGCIRQTANPTKNLILTEESYTNLRLNQKYQRILTTLFGAHSILTVGFSLRDPDFLGLVNDLKTTFGDTMPTIYALMLNPGPEAREYWRANGIEITPYDNHGELLGFFKEVSQLSDHKAVPVGSIPKEQDHGIGRPPRGPDFLYGTLSLDGIPAPAGITLTARVNGMFCGSVTTQSDGIYGTLQYPMLVQSNSNINIKNGEKIEFFANGFKCNETAIFVEWRDPPKRLNLTASIVLLPSIPSSHLTGAIHTGLDINSTIGALLANDVAKAIVDKWIPGFSANPQITMAAGMTLKAVMPMSSGAITQAMIDGITADLAAVK